MRRSLTERQLRLSHAYAADESRLRYAGRPARACLECYGTRPRTLAVEVDVFQPVADSRSLRLVGPGIGLTRLQVDAGTGCQSRSCDQLWCDLDSPASDFAVDVIAEVVQLLPGPPLQQDSSVIEARCLERIDLDRGRSDCNRDAGCLAVRVGDRYRLRS